MSFRAVCRRWRSLAPLCCWSPDSTGSSTTSIQYPWLMLIQREKGICDFYDPRDNVTYHMYNAELSDCVIRFSMDGWLLVSQGPRSMFLYEPFTKERIGLPNLREDYCFNGICFSAPPPSSNSIIFGICHTSPEWVSICYLGPGREKWHTCDLINDRLFLPSWNNPVFLDGYFYCLGQDGSVGVSEVRETVGCTWDILYKPQPLCSPSAISRNFLVSFEKELLSVFVGNSGKWVNVFKLNPLLYEWVEVKSLGNQMLFVSQTASLAVRTQEERMKNKTYFSIFNNVDGNNMFYSMETCQYQTFASDYPIRNFYDTKEQLHSTWIQPRLIPTFQ
ncbi:hypothetical protein L1049_018609 [Liquidambar formosana]|uniref:KIB1-4 beta-propeller domain-containing protein n=1 Tax=Liquidambar formosana TaxID=63359 RepID=A0AAP0RAB7_LIQFO